MLSGFKFWFMLIFFGLSEIFAETEVLLDRVLATVGSGDEKITITAEDLNKAHVANNFEKPSLDLLINRAALYIEAKKFKLGTYTISVSKAEKDAKLEQVKHFLGIPGCSEAQLELALQEKNLQIAELKTQVDQSLAIAQLLNFSFPDKSSIPLSSIEAYYHKNPEVMPERVHLMIAQISSTDLQKLSKESKDLFRNLDPEKLAKKLEFVDLGVVEMASLDDSIRSAVKYSKPGMVNVPDVSSDDLEKNTLQNIVKVVEKFESRLKTLDERKIEIKKLIEVKEREKLYQNYVDGLKEQLFIQKFE